MGQFSASGYDTLKHLEGYTPVAQHLPADRPGVFTGGYGDTQVKPGETHTEAEWAVRLATRVRVIEALVNVRVHVPITPEMFDALVLFCYNVGPGNSRATPPVDGFLTSTLLRKLNAEDYEGAACEFQKWNKVGGFVCPGLTNRRAAEEKLFRAGLALLRAKAA